MDILLSFFWAFIAVVRLRQGLSMREVLPLYLAIQALLVSWSILRRRPPIRKVSFWQEGLAWLSALLPLTIRLGRDYLPYLEPLAIAGVALSILAVNRLGKSFGVAPADRGMVTDGIYRVIRHPMYLGELLAILAASLSQPGFWNGLVLIFALVTTILRIGWEEKVLTGYQEYSQQVRWRLLPGVW